MKLSGEEVQNITLKWFQPFRRQGSKTYFKLVWTFPAKRLKTLPYVFEPFQQKGSTNYFKSVWSFSATRFKTSFMCLNMFGEKVQTFSLKALNIFGETVEQFLFLNRFGETVQKSFKSLEPFRRKGSTKLFYFCWTFPAKRFKTLP